MNYKVARSHKVGDGQWHCEFAPQSCRTGQHQGRRAVPASFGDLVGVAPNASTHKRSITRRYPNVYHCVRADFEREWQAEKLGCGRATKESPWRQLRR